MSDLMAGDILTAADINDALDTHATASAKGLVGITEAVGDQLIANANSPFGSIAVSFPTPTGRCLEVSWSGVISSSDAGDTIRIDIADEPGGDPLCQTFATIDTPNGLVPGYCRAIIHDSSDYLSEGPFLTFQVYVWRPFGTGTGGFVASSARPATLLVKDIGPAI